MKFDAHIITKNGSITAIIDGVPHTVDVSQSNYERIKKALLDNNPAEFLKYKDIAATIENKLGKTPLSVGKVTVSNGQVYYNGKVIHHELTRRILEYVDNNYPFKSLIAFLENLLQNPSMASVDDLLPFLEHRNIPITEDGCFLAYKGVNDDYTDCHTSTFSNVVGSKHSMPRNEVDDNRNNGCSRGFHVGSLQYATTFGRRTVIVKVNPRDAVSVPLCSSEQKLRVCAYEVVGEYTGPLVGPVYKSEGVEPSDSYEEDDDYDFCDESYYCKSGKDIDTSCLCKDMVLVFDYINTRGETKSRSVRILEVLNDRIIAEEYNEIKSFLYNRMSNIIECLD